MNFPVGFHNALASLGLMKTSLGKFIFRPSNVIYYLDHKEKKLFLAMEKMKF